MVFTLLLPLNELSRPSRSQDNSKTKGYGHYCDGCEFCGGSGGIVVCGGSGCCDGGGVSTGGGF